MNKGIIAAKAAPTADFRSSANENVNVKADRPVRHQQQQQNLGCPVRNAIKEQQAQAQSSQL